MRHNINTAHLIDIRDVSVDRNQPKNERIGGFVYQIKDPCHFMYDGLEVWAIFDKNGPPMEKCLKMKMSL